MKDGTGAVNGPTGSAILPNVPTEKDVALGKQLKDVKEGGYVVPAQTGVEVDKKIYVDKKPGGIMIRPEGSMTGVWVPVPPTKPYSQTQLKAINELQSATPAVSMKLPESKGSSGKGHSTPKVGPKTAFEPTNKIFDLAAKDAGVKVGGNHYLSGNDEKGFLHAFGSRASTGQLNGGDTKGQVEALQASHAVTQDKRIGGQTILAVASRIAGNDSPVDFHIKTADDAVACAKAAELLLETMANSTDPKFTPDQIAKVKAKLDSALSAGVSALPDTEKAKVLTAAGKLPNTSSGVADAKAMLTKAATVLPADTLAGMTGDQVVAEALKPGALTGPNGDALKARLAKPDAMVAAAKHPTALNNPGILDAVNKGIIAAKPADLAAVAAVKNPKLQTQLENTLAVLALEITGPPTEAIVKDLAHLHAASQAIGSDKAKADVEGAAKRLIIMATADQIKGKDTKPDGTGGFLNDLKAVFGGTLPPGVAKQLATKTSDVAAGDAFTAKVEADKQVFDLGHTGDANNAYVAITAMYAGGMDEDEQSAAVNIIRNLYKGPNGPANVGALVSRFAQEGKLHDFMSKMDGSDGVKAMAEFVKADPKYVSTTAATQMLVIAQKNDDIGGADTKAAGAIFNAKYKSASIPEKKAMLEGLKEIPATARNFVLTPNTSAMREMYPAGNLASEFGSVFPDRDQKVKFLKHMVDIVSDPKASEADRQWAQKTLDNAIATWKSPLHDSDLSEVQKHITAKNTGAVDAHATALTRTWQKMESDKDSN